MPDPAVSDMPPDEFRARAREVADWIADYLETVGELPVLAPVQPGETAGKLADAAPEEGAGMDRILEEFRRDILPGITHWNHPAFFAYFAISGSGPGILGEMLAAGLNVNAMLWRTAPAATELELHALDWLRQMLGLPAGFRGVIQDTASSASLTALAAARHRAFPRVHLEGLAGAPPLRLYCSEEAHSSIEKAAIALGIGTAGTRRMPTDDRFRIVPEAVEAAIGEDLAAGMIPFCVVGTVGTTSTTAVDPVPALAEIAQRFGLWLHVDAAYAGAAAVDPELRHILDGVAAADSIVVNPHKWLFVPIDCSALYFRDAGTMRAAFSLLPEYLRTPEADEVVNLMDYGVALGRRFRGLKLWMTLRYFGRAGLANRIRAHVELANRFAEWVDEEPDWVLVTPAELSVVVFRHAPAGLTEGETDRHNEEILERVNRSGEAYLSHTRLRGRFALRLAVGNLRTTEAEVRRAWELLRAAAHPDPPADLPPVPQVRR
jgi:aromatic-L-amino-acid/L-tryptophan decarboxylase